jgi:hydrogenase maturation protease
VQAEQLEDYGGSLRDVIKAQIQPSLDIALQWMTRWGVPYRKRDVPLSCGGLNTAVLEMAAYEAGRPSAEEACRIGDDRVLVGMAKG